MSRGVIVAGATGIVGSAAAARFAEAGWEVHGLARSAPAQKLAGVRYHRVDLKDAANCDAIARTIGPVGHIVYAAIHEVAGSLVESWTDTGHVARNAAMLENLLEPVLAASPDFAHIAIMHGTKAYALHLREQGRPPVPLKEQSPRIVHDNFYFAQEDYVSARARAESWSWTIFRAPMILGGGVGSNLNVMLAIAVFAALRRAQEIDLPYPGPATFAGVTDMVDVDLVADAMLWAADAGAARNTIFNIANGDAYIWPDLWGVIADAAGVQRGVDAVISMAEAARDASALWEQLVEQHGLAAPADLRAFLGESFVLADFTLLTPWPALLSTIRLREAGFDGCADTAAAIRKWFDRWRTARLLPPRDAERGTPTQQNEHQALEKPA